VRQFIMRLSFDVSFCGPISRSEPAFDHHRNFPIRPGGLQRRAPLGGLDIYGGSLVVGWTQHHRLTNYLAAASTLAKAEHTLLLDFADRAKRKSHRLGRDISLPS
jgi:hypothetical protein